MKERYNVEYKGGRSRYSTKAADYMYVVVEGEDGEDVELYAEEPGEDNTDSYDSLKAAILEKAREAGIDTDTLVFWYDD